MPPAIKETGKRYGRLTVLKRGMSVKGHAIWICKCDCGNKVHVEGRELRRGGVKSCGCFREEVLKRTKRSLPMGEASFNQLFKAMQYNAKMRNLDWELTKEQVREMTRKNCHYCNIIPSQISGGHYNNGKYTYNGLDRVDSTKGYTVDNVVPCCFTCNRAKNKMSYLGFLSWIEKVYDNRVRKLCH